MREDQKMIPGYEGYYEVSKYGDVRSSWTGRKLKPRLRNGYRAVDLHKNGKRKSYNIAKLVAIVFVPNPDNEPEVNHGDGNRLNDRWDNLEWVPKWLNVFLTSLNGQTRNKLTKKEVLEILSYQGILSGRELSEMYNTDQQTIYKIWRRECWKHI